MQYLSSGTFVLLALASAVVLGVGVWRLPIARRGIIRWMLLAFTLLALLAAAWVAYSPEPDDATDDALPVQVGSPPPTLLMLYSHFCAECVAALPTTQDTVASLIAQGTPLDFVALDIGTEAGQAVRARYGFDPPQTYILFDAQGTERLRTAHPPNAQQIHEALRPGDQDGF